MTREQDFIASLRAIVSDPAARDLLDDAAVLEVGGTHLVLTHDMLVEGIHFLSVDPPESVAWKLVAVNLSDLAAKGAEPLGVLLGYSLGESAWDDAFVRGLGEALRDLGVPLLGGDTVAPPLNAPRAFGLTAIGRAPAGGSPSRGGARAGDGLYVTGTIGDAGAGLEIASRGGHGPDELRAAYRRPMPLLAAGAALAPHVSAMMDVSDGLLLDARRMADASGLALEIALESIPLSAAYVAFWGSGMEARMQAATAGDDYQLLFACTGNLPRELDCPATLIGSFRPGSGLTLTSAGGPVALPGRLGYQHGDPNRP